MTGRSNAYLPRIEWEGLQNPWEVQVLNESPILPAGSERVELRRDEQYRVEAKIFGTPDFSRPKRHPESGQLGDIIPDYRIEGSSHRGGHLYELEHCVVDKVSTKGVESLEADLKTYRVRRTTTSVRGPRAWLTEWYLNGHDGVELYPRPGTRELKETYRRERASPEEEVVFEGAWFESHGSYAYVETPDLGFVVECVPKDLGPSWCRGLAVEYRDAWGGVPEEQVRASIANVVSFVMGRCLVRVGYTAFDERGYAIEEVAVSPLERDLVGLCQQAGHPPVKLDKRNQMNRFEVFEVLMSRLVPRYLELNEELNLDGVIWGYWLSERLPLGVSLPVLATSLEGLKNSWYSSKKSQSRGVYMPKKKFDELLRDELAAMKGKLSEVEHGDRMARRIQDAYRFGVNESLEFFFEELGLPIGPHERSALKARNPMSHGSSSKANESQPQEMLNATFFYRTLFNRVLLKILDYEGPYVDYSAKGSAWYGWPERPLELPLAGRE